MKKVTNPEILRLLSDSRQLIPNKNKRIIGLPKAGEKLETAGEPSYANIFYSLVGGPLTRRMLLRTPLPKMVNSVTGFLKSKKGLIESGEELVKPYSSKTLKLPVEKLPSYKPDLVKPYSSKTLKIPTQKLPSYKPDLVKPYSSKTFKLQKPR